MNSFNARHWIRLEKPPENPDRRRLAFIMRLPDNGCNERLYLDVATGRVLRERSWPDIGRHSVWFEFLPHGKRMATLFDYMKAWKRQMPHVTFDVGPENDTLEVVEPGAVVSNHSMPAAFWDEEGGPNCEPMP